MECREKHTDNTMLTKWVTQNMDDWEIICGMRKGTIADYKRLSKTMYENGYAQIGFLLLFIWYGKYYKSIKWYKRWLWHLNDFIYRKTKNLTIVKWIYK